MEWDTIRYDKKYGMRWKKHLEFSFVILVQKDGLAEENVHEKIYKINKSKWILLKLTSYKLLEKSIHGA